MGKEVEHYNQDWSFVEGQLSSEDEMLVVPSNKYKEVGISLKNKDCGFNFSIAKIELHNGTHGSASKVFESATKLGEQIAKRWNEYRTWTKLCDEKPQIRMDHYPIIYKDSSKVVDILWVMTGYDSETLDNVLEQQDVVEWKEVIL